MTDLGADILRILRIFAPMSNADVGRRLKMDCSKTYREIQRLITAGYVRHPKLQVYLLSPKGQRWFREQPNRPLQLFKEEAQ